jgi:hypothetical protein
MWFLSLGLACSVLEKFTDPSTIPEPTDTTPTTDTAITYELLSSDVLTLGEGRSPGIETFGTKAVTGWFDGTTLFSASIPSLDPEAIELTEVGLGTVDAGRPTFGYAEQRVLVAWDDGLGYGKIRGLLESGGALDELIVAQNVDPGTFRIGVGDQAVGVAAWTSGGAITLGGFDRLLTDASAEIPVGATAEVFDAVDLGGGTLLAAWGGTALGDEGGASALRGAHLPADGSAWDAVDAGVERTGPIAVARRASDGEPLFAWVGPGGALHLYAPAVGATTALAGTTVRGAPSVAWANDLPAVAWQDDTGLHVRVLGLPEGGDEFFVAAAPNDAGPDIASRPLNDGSELLVVWDDAGSIQYTEIVIIER